MFFKKKNKTLPAVMPNHVSFIIDGNGRWAQKRGLPRLMGHRKGMQAVEDTIKNLVEFKIPYASFYCFSTENWKRDNEEVNGLFQIFRDYASRLDSFKEKNVKVLVFGDMTKFPEDMQKSLKDLIEATKNNTGLTVMLCLNYGGRDEITMAVNKLLKSGKKEVTKEDISNSLYSAGIPDPDLVIRTSGENRVSNYMLWQIAYSELYFPKTYWPDFDRSEFIEALWAYSKRNRRFGGLKK